MKSTFVLIFCFLSFLIYSQDINRAGIIHYQESYGEVEKQSYELHFYGNESIYEKIFPASTGQPIQTIMGFIEPQIKSIYHYNIKSKQLIFQEGIAFKPVVIKEDQIDIDWKIEQEIKKIGDFNCQKATTFYKGYNYIAWFTIDIPVSFGPWKFHGLPGLILECYDASNFFSMKATKINLNADAKNVTEKIKKANLVNPISMEQYVKLKLSENEDIYNFYLTLSPRDSYLSVETDYTGFMKEPLKK